MAETFFSLANLITECDVNTLYQTLFVSGSDGGNGDKNHLLVLEIISQTIKLLEHKKTSRVLVPNLF